MRLAPSRLFKATSRIATTKEMEVKILLVYNNYMRFLFETPGIELELTNLCNADCIMCPRDAVKKRGSGIMDEETLWSVVRACKQSPVKMIVLAGLGEPLLNKNFFNYVKILKEELNNIKILLITNGSFLDENNAKRLIDLHVEGVVFSIQSISSQLYKKLMPGLDYTETIKNVHKLHEMLPSWMHMNINFTMHKMNKNELSKFLFYWQRYNVEVVKGPIHSRGGHITDPNIIDPVQNNTIKQCKLFENFVSITWDGKILPCCQDVDGGNVIGDIHNNTLEDIKNIKSEIIKENKWFPICYKCDDTCRNILGDGLML